jgi:hypothetical protein
MERLVKPLAAEGIHVTGIKLMKEGPRSTDLRYFYSDDGPKARQVTSVLRKFGLRPARVKHIKGFETRATRGQYELWLAPLESPGEL